MECLSEILAGQDWIGLGVAGNQAGHLKQAGEESDFAQVEVAKNAPKGMFPWYVPGGESFLSVNPLSSQELRIYDETHLQPEPEISLVVEFQYSGETDYPILGMRVKGFSVLNDCSRRVEAPKISYKKNWGVASQGIGTHMIELSDFTSQDGMIEQFRLGSYLLRDGELLQYGVDTAVSDYCYFNQTLVDWVVNQINTQEDFGPLENLRSFIARQNPKFGIIGIGATCYTEFGNSKERFLRQGDQLLVVAYNSECYEQQGVEDILRMAGDEAPRDDILILRQQVVT